ncbi:MAG: SDR family oxidoreductase [Aquisalimonadaceae bacterium]
MTSLQDLFSLQGRCALVTGGSSGLGAEMATALANAGARVLLVARRPDALEKVKARIERDGGVAETIAADISTDDGLAQVVSRARALGQHVDILINAAGINPRKPALELTREEWDATLHLNLSVPFFLARELVEPMMEAGWGRIINIGSLQSVRAFPDSAPYGASKGGVVQLTRAMAEAWSARGVCCNAIAPGLFPTELTQALYKNSEAVAQMATKTCCGRNGELSDAWGLAVFLASPASAFITGQTIYLDGGLTAK